MARRLQTQIYSIFGQIEEAAAESLINRTRARKIPYEDIPIEARYNERGDQAKFAIVVPGEHIAEFEKICADLRA